MDFDSTGDTDEDQKPLLLICGGREYAVKTDGSLAVGFRSSGKDIRGSGRCQEQERYWARAGIKTVSQAQMKETVEYMCSFSVYAAEEELRQGFITIQAGTGLVWLAGPWLFGQDIRLVNPSPSSIYG